MTSRSFSAEEIDRIMLERRHDSRAAVKAFADACQRSEVKAFLKAFDQVRISADGWPMAIMAASKLTTVSQTIT